MQAILFGLACFCLQLFRRRSGQIAQRGAPDFTGSVRKRPVERLNSGSSMRQRQVARPPPWIASQRSPWSCVRRIWPRPPRRTPCPSASAWRHAAPNASFHLARPEGRGSGRSGARREPERDADREVVDRAPIKRLLDVRSLAMKAVILVPCRAALCSNARRWRRRPTIFAIVRAQ